MKSSRNFAVKKIHKLILLLDKPYERLLFNPHVKKSYFCTLANFRSFFSTMLGKDYRVQYAYNRKSGIYTFSDDMFRIQSFHEKLGLWSYQRGLKNRAKDMGTIYHLDQINFKPGDLVIDCGANVGDLMMYFKHNNHQIEYIGIEPAPLEYKSLVENVYPMKCLNIGLWFEQDTIDFYLAGQLGDSSFIEPKKFDSVVKIDAFRLDALINRKVKLLKIEAEGAEPEVLLGAEKLLHQVSFVSADLGFERGPNAESTLIPVINFLSLHNFELISISHKRIIALFKNKSID